ncbi:MAG: sucrase ferredoxin [Prochloraceae cyanobacterium]|nr:sucrase ferredoxin [Prochloraceae cyanobacterium]
MDNFFCAEESRQANEELIGSAGNYQIYILIECPPPWASELFESKAISPSMKAQSFELAKEIMSQKILVRPLLIYNEKLKQENGTRLIIYEVEAGSTVRRRSTFDSQPKGLANSYSKQEFLLDKLEDATSVVRDYLADKEPNATKIESSTRDILVCTHGSHDRCCARYGKPFYYEALATVSDLALDNIRIWQCSHFGGHRFAPTAIDLPEGRWYGRLDRNTFTSILTRKGDINLFNNVYRGWGILSKLAQVLECQLLLEHGWEWLDYQVSCKAIKQNEDCTSSEIELIFQTPDGVTNTYQAEVVKDENKTVCLRTGCNKSETAKLPKLVVKSLVKV